RLVLPRWPAALDGLRLAVVADIHAGAPWIDDEKVERLVAEVNDTRPDLVLLLGDFVILEVLGGRPGAAGADRGEARRAARPARWPGGAADPRAADRPLALRAALCDRARRGGRAPPLRHAGDRDQHHPGALRRPAGDLAPHARARGGGAVSPICRSMRAWRARFKRAVRPGESRFIRYITHASGEMGATARRRAIALRV